MCGGLLFWNLKTGYKVHDARVFGNSSLYCCGRAGTLSPQRNEIFERVDVPHVILGDSAYPFLPWLMKPFPEGSGIRPEQIQFNQGLSQAGITVERVFGRLKGRWRCLLKRNNTHITFISPTIMDCCVLHNCCELHNKYVSGHGDAGLDGSDDAAAARGNHANAGRDIRNALFAYSAV